MFGLNAVATATDGNTLVPSTAMHLDVYAINADALLTVAMLPLEVSVVKFQPMLIGGGGAGIDAMSITGMRHIVYQPVPNVFVLLDAGIADYSAEIFVQATVVGCADMVDSVQANFMVGQSMKAFQLHLVGRADLCFYEGRAMLTYAPAGDSFVLGLAIHQAKMPDTGGFTVTGLTMYAHFFTGAILGQTRL